MAHGGLRQGARGSSTSGGLFLVAALALGCADRPPSPPAQSASAEDRASARPPDYPIDDAAWGKFHSKRFQLKVPLPDGKAWRIDDHRHPELVAVHPPTQSRLSVLATQEEELMNRHRCEERANKIGFVPKTTGLTTVEDHVHVGPDAYDSRVWVAIDASKPDGSVDGHVFLFGAFLRRCLLVHVSTTVPSGKDEAVLAGRLAIASTRIVKGISVDPLRTTDDATIPRDRPDIRR